MSWTGGLWVAALVLFWSGTTKLADPNAVSRAMLVLGVGGGRSTRRLVGRALGMIEVATASGAIALGGRWAAASIATLFGLFTLVALRLAHQNAESCGCFGDDSAPAGPVLVLVDLLMLGTTIPALLVEPPGLIRIFGERPMSTVVVAALAVVGAGVVITAATSGAQLQFQMKRRRAILQPEGAA